MAEIVGSAQFRGAAFRMSDLSGTSFRDCDLSGVRIASCQVDDLRVTGFDGQAGRVVVDDVDVTSYVAAELDRRHPERVQVRAARTADDHRAAWALLERLWDGTVERAERLPEAARHERVDGEWSVVETLRHLVFAVDSWVGRVVLGDPAPNHPGGLVPTDIPDEAAAALGIDVTARPSWAEAVAMHAERRAQARRVLAGLTDAGLDEVRRAALMPGEEPETFDVRHAVRVLLREHSEHRRYAERDLAVLEQR